MPTARTTGAGLIGPHPGSIVKHRFGCETLRQTERNGMPLAFLGAGALAFTGGSRTQQKHNLQHRIVDPLTDIFRFYSVKKRKRHSRKWA